MCTKEPYSIFDLTTFSIFSFLGCRQSVEISIGSDSSWSSISDYLHKKTVLYIFIPDNWTFLSMKLI